MPVRMMVMVVLGASVLSAFGFRELFRQLPNKKILTIILLGLLLFETMPRPLPVTRIEVPDYVTALAALPNDGGVVDLVTTGMGFPLYYQTIHGKPITFGYVSRLSTSVYFDDVDLTKTINDHNYGKLWGTYHIRYIITQHDLQPPLDQPYISIQTVYDQKGISIYRIGCVCEINK
jgi:hypothetical protein